MLEILYSENPITLTAIENRPLLHSLHASLKIGTGSEHTK